VLFLSTTHNQKERIVDMMVHKLKCNYSYIKIANLLSLTGFEPTAFCFQDFKTIFSRLHSRSNRVRNELKNSQRKVVEVRRWATPGATPGGQLKVCLHKTGIRCHDIRQVGAVRHKFKPRDTNLCRMTKLELSLFFCRPTRHALGKRFFSVWRHLNLPYGNNLPYGTSKKCCLV
jgi:hypothetical protein